jgi:hypothetical protein
LPGEVEAGRGERVKDARSQKIRDVRHPFSIDEIAVAGWGVSWQPDDRADPGWPEADPPGLSDADPAGTWGAWERVARASALQPLMAAGPYTEAARPFVT